MITREMYMKGKATHDEYYSQFVTPALMQAVVNKIGVGRILGSSCPHFNDIPLGATRPINSNTITWQDVLPTVSSAARCAQLREAGDYMTQAGAVCIAKQAAKMWLEQSTKEAKNEK